MEETPVCYPGAVEQARLLARGAVTAAELLATAEHRLSSSRHVFTDVDLATARRSAEEADRRLAGGAAGGLLGLPLAVEDSLPRSAFDALVAAGAVVIGRTSGAEIHRNPTPGMPATALDPKVSGTAVAVATGVVSAVLARRAPGAGGVPAGGAGVVGFETSGGRGVVARTVADVAHVVRAIGWAAEPADRPLRIGVSLRGIAMTTRTRPSMRRVVEDVASLLSLRVGEVVDHDPHLASESRLLLAPHLAAGPRELDLLDRFVPSPLRGICRSMRAAERVMVDHMFTGVDVLVTPGHTGPAETMSLPGGVLVRNGATSPFSPLWKVSGYPAVSVRAGSDADGNPLPVTLIAVPKAEGELLRVAGIIEEERDAHRSP
ncbi:amidase [Lentzea californiensis]|nr:amidase [Lentzea californiensis]